MSSKNLNHSTVKIFLRFKAKRRSVHSFMVSYRTLSSVPIGQSCIHLFLYLLNFCYVLGTVTGSSDTWFWQSRDLQCCAEDIKFIFCVYWGIIYVKYILPILSVQYKLTNVYRSVNVTITTIMILLTILSF